MSIRTLAWLAALPLALTLAPVPASAVPTAAPSNPATNSRATTSAAQVAVVPRRLVGKNLERVPTRAKVVALTFDAGGDDAGVAKILATLAAQHVPSTFVLTGHWARYYPRQARRIAALYPVANHSETHPDMTHLSAARAAAQVRTAAASIRRVTGRYPVALFRFPYGAFDRSTIRTVNGVGYACIGWTVDTLGWQGTSGGRSASSVTNRVLRAVVPGEIVLMHVGANPDDRTTLDAAALPRIISGLRAKGYTFVTLTTALGVS